MKLMPLVGLAVVAVAGLLSTSTHAWTITSADALQASDVVGKNQGFVKVWTVRGASPINAIKFAALGSAFIDYDPTLITEAPTTSTPLPSTSANSSTLTLAGSVDSSPAVTKNEPVVAQILLRGNGTDLLNEIAVVERAGAITIHFQNQNFRGLGYVFTQVVVSQRAALAKVSISGASKVYINDHVIASNATTPVAFAVSGSGDIFVSANTTALSLASLKLKVSGMGTIQFHAASLTVRDSLVSKISGMGTIAVVANAVHVGRTIETKVSGMGDVYVQAANVTAAHMNTELSGRSTLTFSTNGTCGTHVINLTGSGNVSAGSIRCENTTITVSGQGSVLVQTSDTITFPHGVHGRVQYWGPPPQHIINGRESPTPCPPRTPSPTHNDSFWSRFWEWLTGWWGSDSSDPDSDCGGDDSQLSFPNGVTAATENNFQTYALHALPPRDAKFYIVVVRQNRHSSQPDTEAVVSVRDWDTDSDDSASAVDDWDMDSDDSDSVDGWDLNVVPRVHTQQRSVGTVGPSVFAVAVVAAVGVAVYKVVMQRRRRSEYQPLIHVVAN